MSQWVFECISWQILVNYCFFDDFTVQHVSRHENAVVNGLAQQASGFWSNRGKIIFLEKTDIPVCQIRQFSFQPVCSATVGAIGPSPAKMDSSISETGWSRISRSSDK
jgi:hypothetical protein